MITQPTKSKSLFEVFKESVIVSVGDYFCCIHIFSAKLLISSQTFFNLKYIQKLEIYEFDVRFIFTPTCGGRICHVLLTVQKTHRRPLLFIDNRHFIGVAYNLGETQTCNSTFLLFCREILESVRGEEQNFEVLTRNISKYM